MNLAQLQASITDKKAQINALLDAALADLAAFSASLDQAQGQITWQLYVPLSDASTSYPDIPTGDPGDWLRTAYPDRTITDAGARVFRTVAAEKPSNLIVDRSTYDTNNLVWSGNEPFALVWEQA